MAYRKREKEVVNTETIFENGIADDIGFEVMPEPAPPEKKERVVAPRTKKYENDSLVPCRSIVQGYLNFKGKKTDTVYQWESVNDITNIEYQDLRSAMLSRSDYVMRPYFIIEDDDLLALPEWKDVKSIYDRMYSKEDLREIFRIASVDEMGRVLSKLPDGVKKGMGNIAKEMMERGTLDSIKKIKKIDEILGTDLRLYMGEVK